MKTGNKVLVAEDDQFSFEFLRLALRSRNLELIHAPDGEKALNIFNGTGDIALVLLDLQLPRLSGYDVCKRIRGKDPHVPIIIQTAHIMESDRNKCEAAGCSGFLTKPINIGKLLDLIDRYLS